MRSAADPLRVGILGCSDIAARRFVPALRRTGAAVLSSVASRDRARAGRFVPGVEYRPLTYEEMADGGNAELVYVSLPNDRHEEWVLRCLRGGKHVLCEKPLGLSPRSVERMTGCARERGLTLVENIMFLHHRQHRLVRDLIGAGKIGAVRRLRASFGFLLADPGNFRSDPARGGGAFYDLIRYPLAIAGFLLPGRLDRVAGIRLTRNGLNVGVHAHAATDRGVVLDLSVSFAQQYESLYEVTGERGAILLERAFTTPPDLENTIRLTVGTERSSIAVSPDDHFLRMIDHVAGLVRSHGDREAEYRRSEVLADTAERIWNSCREIVIP
jgi:NDP-hexose-3-ketoreductase